MQKISLFEAKTNLSKLVERARRGEEVIITTGRDKKPVARIVAFEHPPKKKREPGLSRGAFRVGPEFFEPLPEEDLRLWEGDKE